MLSIAWKFQGGWARLRPAGGSQLFQEFWNSQPLGLFAGSQYCAFTSTRASLGSAARLKARSVNSVNSPFGLFTNTISALPELVLSGALLSAPGGCEMICVSSFIR